MKSQFCPHAFFLRVFIKKLKTQGLLSAYLTPQLSAHNNHIFAGSDTASHQFKRVVSKANIVIIVLRHVCYNHGIQFETDGADRSKTQLAILQQDFAAVQEVQYHPGMPLCVLD